MRKALYLSGAGYLGLVGVAVSLVALSGSWADTSLGGTCGAPTLADAAPGQAGRPTGSEESYAQVIVGVGKALGIPSWGWVVALATALQESGLENLDSGSGSALGLFQQQPPSGWGTPAQVTDPAYAAEAFYGAQPIGGTRNDGLLEVPNWQSLPLTVAAQDVQHSAYPDAYAKWQPEAEELAAENASAPSVALPLAPRVWGPGGGSTTGSDSTVLTSAQGCPDLQGQGQAVSVIAAAERYLGTPYSWGGGNDSGPTLGIAEGAHTVGFDCSGLVMYAFWQGAGIQLPRTANIQYALTKANSVPLSSLQPRDLVFFEPSPDGPGHVVIYIGEGQVIEAPHTGAVVDIEPLSAVMADGFAGATRVLTRGQS